MAVFLRFLLFGTRTGIAMRAVVDDRPLAQLTGSRPDRSAMLAWAIGTSLAALSGILLAGSQGVAQAPRPDPAGHQRLRRGHVRPAAQPAR